MKLESILEYGEPPVAVDTERRAVDRSAVPDVLNAMADHMHKIKRALDSGNTDIARKLLNGAIRALQSHQNDPIE